MTIGYGSLIEIDVYIYYDDRKNSHLTGYYRGYFNPENVILYAVEKSGKSVDEFGIEMGGDYAIYFRPIGNNYQVDNIMVSKESWEKIKKHYAIEP